MCCGDDDDGVVTISDVDRARLQKLRATAVEALLEANEVLAKYVDVDKDSIDSVTIGLRSEVGSTFDGVPPVYQDPCVQFNSAGVCAYYECDPPGVTKPCPPVTLPPPT